jgi:hypothetical protein
MSLIGFIGKDSQSRGDTIKGLRLIRQTGCRRSLMSLIGLTENRDGTIKGLRMIRQTRSLRSSIGFIERDF